MTSSTSLEKEKTKLVQEKCQQLLTNLLKDEDNKYCVDCDGKSPRWASWNIGIFLCIRCAGIHRNLGVHISKVKSVNLDTWTPQQVACIEQMGNSRARAVYEANLPDTFLRPQTDSSLEQFVRAKYEAKKYIAKEWVEPPMPQPTWEIIIEKQLMKKKDRKSSIGKINFPTSKTPVNKSKNISPKPLPKAPSSKSSPNQIQKTSKDSPQHSENGDSKISPLQDLLGLDVSNESNDPFGDFLSAPMLVTVDNAEPKLNGDQLSDEMSFFNQKQPEILGAEKLSKDSILALYAKMPNQTQQNSFGGMQGMNSSLGHGHQNVTNMQQVYGGYQQNTTTFHQAPAVNNISSGVMQNQLFSQGNVTSSATPQMVPIVPVGFKLSAANPFAQMQSQMALMTMTGVNSRPPAMMGQNVNTHLMNSPPVSTYLSEKNTATMTNLWQ